MSETINTDRRQNDGTVQVISQKLMGLETTMSEMRQILRELTTAVTRLAVVEERQVQATQATERAFREIEKNGANCDFHHTAMIAENKTLSSRISALELQAPTTKQTNTWVVGFIVALATTALLFVASKVGLT